MKAQELRIGNWVKPDDMPEEQVTLEMFATIHSTPRAFHYIEPIPLTEDWLIKFGFEKLDEKDICRGFKITHPNEMFDYIVDNIGDKWHISIDQDQDLNEWYAFTWDVLYVHQLQNLFYCLTGEELKLKQ